MLNLPDYLFTKHNLNEFLSKRLRQAVQSVDTMPEAQFNQSGDQDIVSHLCARLEVLPIELQLDQKEMDRTETEIDVSSDRRRNPFGDPGPLFVKAIKVRITIPFAGESMLFDCQPSTYRNMPPRAFVHGGQDEEGGTIDVVIQVPMDMASDPSYFKREVDDTVDGIEWYLQQVTSSVHGHNQQLRTTIQQAVSNRRQRLGKFDAIAEALNIPLKQRPGAPNFANLQLKRRIVKPLPRKSRQPVQHVISDKDYQDILTVIRHGGSTFEKTPKTYSTHDEEGLRDLMLANLSTVYAGLATAEAFRKKGKTDICIEMDNRAAFVAECKVWRGPKELGPAVDQLLSYLTWRDCKTALVIFNKDVAGFSGIQTKLPNVLRQHSNFISETKLQDSGEWRMVFRSADDENRQITVHVFLFDLYVRNAYGGDK